MDFPSDSVRMDSSCSDLLGLWDSSWGKERTMGRDTVYMHLGEAKDRSHPLNDTAQRSSSPNPILIKGKEIGLLKHRKI